MTTRVKKKGGFFGKMVRLALIFALLFSGIIIIWISSLSIPELESFEKRKIKQSTKIYDRTGEILLYDIHENVRRTTVAFSDMSRHIKNATVAIEDAEFYEHNGIKPKSILRAILVNIGALEFSQGGSTITQQVVKNSILTPEKKISRKLKEWALAIKLEKKMSKEKILELYLNESPYGGNIYGIEEASKTFFGKIASELSLSESAYLAALPQAPTFYSPYGNNKDKLEKRKNLVLKEMLNNNFITDDEYETANSEEVSFKPRQEKGIKAPHFVFFIREYLENKYGKHAVEENGFKVITTLNYDLQKKAEDIVLNFAKGNEEKFNAENAGMVAIDPKTGQILVMVGSRDYFDEDIDGNFNVVISPNRQPGSVFKPFVYATAFKNGYTPETRVFDLKTQFAAKCAPDDLTSENNCYSPVNYDGVFKGPISFRNALAQSINIPAIKVLYLSGLQDSLRTAKDMGISSLTDINRYGLTLVLGGGEVSLLEMTNAYGVFANGGIRNPYAGILRVEDMNGDIIEKFAQKPIRVLDENVALQISNILSDEEARAPAFGRHSYLYFSNRDVAVKTGTTNDYVDAWIIGYTPNIAVGSWAGNNDNSSMEKKVAGFIVAPMWNAFMNEALAVIENERFKKPQEKDRAKLKPTLKGMWGGGVSYFIDKMSGKLATEFTPKELIEERVVPDVHSILYWVDKKDPNGPIPENPENDPQFNLWEYQVEKWKKDNNIITNENYIIPTEFDDIHKPEFEPNIKITSPISGIEYGANNKVIVSIQNTSKFPLVKVGYFVNGIFIGSSNKNPFSFSFIPSESNLTTRENKLKVVGYDSVLNRGVSEVVFSIRY